MKQKSVYAVPESEVLELRQDRSFLDYESQGEATDIEKPYIIQGQWD